MKNREEVGGQGRKLEDRENREDTRSHSLFRSSKTPQILQSTLNPKKYTKTPISSPNPQEFKRPQEFTKTPISSQKHPIKKQINRKKQAAIKENKKLKSLKDL